MALVFVKLLSNDLLAFGHVFVTNLNGDEQRRINCYNIELPLFPSPKVKIASPSDMHHEKTDLKVFVFD